MSQLKWQENWRRSYRISVGTREVTKDKYLINTDVVGVYRPSQESDYVTIPSNARLLSNLESDGFSVRGFNFKLNAIHKAKTNGSDGETSTLDLFNIDTDLIDVINQNEAVVIVEAGYADQVELAYSGDIIRVESFRLGADIVHRLHCRSGGFDFRNTFASLNYSEEMSDGDILLDMYSRLPNSALGTYGIEQLKAQKKTGGRSFIGSLITNIDKLAEENNLNWCHFNGKIVIIPYRLLGEDYDLFSRTNFNLPVDSIKNVSVVSDRQDKGVGTTKSRLRKYQINTFYIPLEIGQFVTIPNTKYTKDTSGTYQVKSRRLLLDSKGAAWDTILEVEELEL